MASRREVIIGAAAVVIETVLPAGPARATPIETVLPPAPVGMELTRAQRFARATLTRRLNSNAFHLAQIEAMANPTPAEEAIAGLYRLCRDKAADELDKFDRGEGLWWRTSTYGRHA